MSQSITIKSERELYGPIKRFLEAQGYEVKGEVGAADIVACRGKEAPVIVEMKLAIALSLFHQAVARQAITDAVYIAVPHKSGHAFLKSLKKTLILCRRLGLGLITVRKKTGTVIVHADPGPYRPRKSKQRTEKLLGEFRKRTGDPNVGGATRRHHIMTAYRQDALRCVSLLNRRGPTKAAVAAALSGVSKARRIMSDNHYGWFERVTIGTYQLTPAGRKAICAYADEIERIETPPQHY
ncbi:MAG: DUF2161 domain-containing phosphodiesterase [Hyphomicrobiaceae bacterium]